MSETRPAVLIVDDVDANLVALEALLADMPCELVRAKNGNEALKQLLKREFALMLLDVQMPGMDGYEVASYSRDNPATRDVPIIFVTAMHETIDNTLRSYGTGAVDLLYKPINPQVLRSKIRVFLDLHNSKRELQNEIAAHRATLAELELANAALRHFTYAASHDLHAPLRAVRGYLQALDEDVGGGLGKEAQHYLERSLEASTRMVALLDALLVYARLQKPADLVDVDCETVVRQVQSDLADRIDAAHAEVTLGKLPKVLGDSGRLYQLFLNLVSNGIKFRRPGTAPHVRISARERDGTHVFCVEDDGIGIDAEHKDTVFDAFRRLNKMNEFEGTGLGLTICQQIVQQHGGKIWVEAEPDKGSKFWFTLGAGPPP